MPPPRNPRPVPKTLSNKKAACRTHACDSKPPIFFQNFIPARWEGISFNCPDLRFQNLRAEVRPVLPFPGTIPPGVISHSAGALPGGVHRAGVRNGDRDHDRGRAVRPAAIGRGGGRGGEIQFRVRRRSFVRPPVRRCAGLLPSPREFLRVIPQCGGCHLRPWRRKAKACVRVAFPPAGDKRVVPPAAVRYVRPAQRGAPARAVFQEIAEIVPRARRREVLRQRARAQRLNLGAGRVHGHRGVRDGDAGDFSLAQLDLVPADVLLPLLCDRVGVPVRKSNKETMTNEEILGDGRDWTFAVVDCYWRKLNASRTAQGRP